ncbi:MAG: error-prone DNA polymerase, partial [Bowdeniella nasicola]|nr:error-prone DNA polymerase [Bowdeniella nasicola]
APNFPPFPVPAGHDEASWLRELTYRGAKQRYGPPTAERVEGAYAMIEHELALITELGFPGYFLIVHEIVEFCRTHNILCQGRGSAANSAVCYALGITAVDAVRHRLLFERFLSPGRSGPPDIDVDIEAGRREEVIQFVYRRYGRRHAALVANVITYRHRLALRDAARALGYSAGASDAMSKTLERGVGLDSNHRYANIPDDVATLATAMTELPRHLGIHPGGMVLCDRPIVDVCPVQWAAMPGRSILQWDKDDCADAGLVKFDLLGLGMLTALRHAFTTLERRGVRYRGAPLALHHLPQEDPGVYALLCAADTIGVFQVESRAQMQTLPRLRPQCFYDIVIEVALVRPGPIQGGSVNPYLRRRLGKEPVRYAHPLLRNALKKTLGVPLFQEQLMQIAIDAAGFCASEADQLRKAMGAKRSAARMEALRERLFSGMAARGIQLEVAEEIYTALKGFAAFGFPESHAFSFAYLVYASAYLKVHHPEAFYAGLLAAQPMGFYSPQSLIADARRHGVHVLAACIHHSGPLAQVVSMPPPQCCQPDTPTAVGSGKTHREYDANAAARVHADQDSAIQLGLASIRQIGTKVANRIAQVRTAGAFTSLTDLASRAELSAAQLEALATAGALRGFGQRRTMMWAAGPAASGAGQITTVGRKRYHQLPIPGLAEQLSAPELPALRTAEHTALEVWSSGVSSIHPLALVRAT